MFKIIYKKYNQFPNVCKMLNLLSENIYEDEYIALSTKQYFLILLKKTV